MSEEQWNAIDRYISEALLPPDKVLEAALLESERAGLPNIAVAPNQGKLLHLLARSLGARRILEIGTLGGYSAIWLGRALPPDGQLVSLELDPVHAQVACTNIARAELSDRVEVRVGAALDSLSSLSEQRAGPFDLTFIDADKANIPGYFGWALKMSRPGQPDHRGQRHPTRGGPRSRQRRPGRSGGAPAQSTDRRGAAGQRHGAPDRRQQGA